MNLLQGRWEDRVYFPKNRFGKSLERRKKMSKKFLSLLAITLFALALFAGNNSRVWAAKIPIEQLMQLEKLASPLDLPYAFGEAIPPQPGIALTSPGYLVGTTYYDYQTNGSSGNRIVKDAFGGIHIDWMNGINSWSGNRWVYYNFRDESGAWSWTHTGKQVSKVQGSGYCQLSTFSDGRAAPAYHSVPNLLYVVVGIDALRGFGEFDELDAPECPCDSYQVWPYETIDRSGRIHLAFAENSGTATPQGLCYTRSEDEGNTWSEPALADTLMDISQVLTSSRVSDKVCLAFTHPRTLVDPNQVNNDMCYYESLDGLTWNFNGGMVNVTNYETDDTLRAYTDCDAVYDYNDNLHLLWNTPGYWEGVGADDAKCMLYHWSEATGLTLVANAWWESTAGAWNRSISKMSLGVDEDNNIYALWTQFTNDDNSVAGYSNGELYVCGSRDGGAHWSPRRNVTNSPTPDCWPQECDSDHWSTLAETVDDSLYIVYINDKDAGGIPQTEGQNVQNNVMYLAVDTLVVWTATGVEEEEASLPAAFGLKQNYPNPFNASTTIDYVTLTSGQVQLAVYNLRGEKVEVLVNEVMPAGEHTVTWDASNVATGVYYYKLSSSEGTITKRALLLK
jgi:hypothetical protein